MAILKSIELQMQELREKEAQECYAIMQSWEPKKPITLPRVDLPALAKKVDEKAFGYDYANVPNNNVKRYPIRSTI